jgi:hypothetical protein
VHHIVVISFIALVSVFFQIADALDLAAVAMDCDDVLALIIASRGEVVGNIRVLAR